jgi:hypothetical protein
VIVARGFRTIPRGSRTELRGLGFSDPQSRLVDNAAALLIPLWNTAGQPDGYQLRPDQPRPDGKREGKPRKYEALPGRPLNLDVPPGCIPALRDVEIPLHVTEAPIKADALATAGARAVVSMPGVYGWRGNHAQAAIDALPWKGRRVYLVPDSDSQTNPDVRAAIWRFGSLVQRRGALPVFVQLPHATNGTKQGVDDWLAAGGRLEQLDSLIVASVVLFDSPSVVDGRTLPKVLANDHLRVMVDKAVAALVEANDPPALFARGGEPVHIVRDEAEREHIRAVGPGALAVVLSRAADFVRLTETHELKVTPPKPVVDGVLAEVAGDLPGLRYVATAPILRPDGTVAAERGYDEATRVFLALDGELAGLDVPISPTKAQVVDSAAALEDVLCDFPFEDAASKAHAFALILTPMIRCLFDGPTPLFLVDKPAPGSGAGILVDVASMIATGDHARVATYTNDDAELRKRITALLAAGHPMIVLDNVEATLRSGELSAALTARYWRDRILGTGRVGEWPNLATWVATGNNVRLGGDMPRRVLPIRLNPKVARPWNRPPSDFHHPHLIEYVASHRARLLAAALTICTGWVDAGRPSVEVRPFGSFEGWASPIGGILAFAGIPGFLDNLSQFWDEADENATRSEAFLTRWAELLGATPQTTATLAENVVKDGWGDVVPDWPGDEKLGLARRIGYWLRANRDRRFGPFTLIRVGAGHAGVARWAVERSGGDAPTDFVSPPHHHHDHHQAELDMDGGDGGDVSDSLRTCAGADAHTPRRAGVGLEQSPPSSPADTKAGGDALRSPAPTPGELVEVLPPATAGHRCLRHEFADVFRPRPDAAWLCRYCGTEAVPS